MTTEEIAATIIANVRRDTEALQTERCRRVANSSWRNRSQRFYSQKVADAHEGIVPYKPSDWLGRSLTGSERVKFCQILKRLRESGMVNCFSDSRGRTTHVALTEAGKSASSAILYG